MFPWEGDSKRPPGRRKEKSKTPQKLTPASQRTFLQEQIKSHRSQISQWERMSGDQLPGLNSRIQSWIEAAQEKIQALEETMSKLPQRTSKKKKVSWGHKFNLRK
jgi:hypothetical protein